MIRQICFGEWRFSPEMHVLTRGSTTVTLEPLVARLLEFFLEHPDELISHDRLVQEVWRGRIVSDEAVRRGVSSLRHALARAGGEPFIRTVHKRGYIANVPPLTQRDGGVNGHEPVSSSPATATAADPATIESSTTSAGRDRRPPGRATRVGHLPWFLVLAAVLTLAAVTGLWRYRESAEAPAVTADTVAPRTIAVLPFVDLSDEPGREYFSDGVAEELRRLLARFSEFRVTARTSSSKFSGGNQDIREIGKQLGVRYLVEGSVRRDGDEIRIAATLIDAGTGFQLWADSYDSKLADLFDAQADIAGQVARALQIVLVSRDGRGRLAPKPASSEAYLEYLQGQRLTESWATDDLDAAIGHFQNAIDLDPEFAIAYARLAEAMLLRANLTLEWQSAAGAALPLIEKALALDPGLGAAYVTRAILRNDTAEQEAELRKGLDLNPSYAPGYERLADVLFFRQLVEDRSEEAFAMIDRARALDPLRPRNHHMKALMHVQQGEDEQAAALEREALRVDPRFRSALAMLGLIEGTHKGEYARAVTYLEKARAIDPRVDWLRANLVSSYLDMADPEAARRLIASAPPIPEADLLLFVYTANWRDAGELVYASDQPVTPAQWLLSDANVLLAHALVTGEFSRAREFESGRYHFGDAVPERLSFFQAAVFLQVALLDFAAGDRERSRPRIERLLARMLQVQARRPGLAYQSQPLVAQGRALLGDREAALAALEDAMGSGDHLWRWWWVLNHPVFDVVRADPRFRKLLSRNQTHAASQRALLDTD